MLNVLGSAHCCRSAFLQWIMLLLLGCYSLNKECICSFARAWSGDGAIVLIATNADLRPNFFKKFYPFFWTKVIGFPPALLKCFRYSPWYSKLLIPLW